MQSKFALKDANPCKFEVLGGEGTDRFLLLPAVLDSLPSQLLSEVIGWRSHAHVSLLGLGVAGLTDG